VRVLPTPCSGNGRRRVNSSTIATGHGRVVLLRPEDEEEPAAAVGDRTVGSSRVAFFGSAHTVSHGLPARHEGGQTSELLYEVQAREGVAHSLVYT
jgi:hypothetical protein